MPRVGRPARARLVTLTSDLGGAYAAQMKAVLLRSLDPSRVVDLIHDLPAHGIREAAFVVRAIASGFPAGTVHVVVVDPGVGGTRAPIVIDCQDGSALVGPDNGVLVPLAEILGIRAAYRIDPRRLGTSRTRVGTTFDGRDLFAPAAARLATGGRASALGPATEVGPLQLARPIRRARSAGGEILHVDRFGNLITNLPSGWVPTDTRRLEFRIERGRFRSVPWATSYEAIGRGRVGTLASSFGTVEVAVVEGSAADRFHVRAGARIEVRWRRGHRPR